MTDCEFREWPKMARLNRDIVITEKIDGTNACIIFEDGHWAAQSRKRLITPDDDNFGFASWVDKNSEALYETLGEGYHYGEWWGSGIQRGYGLPKGEKRFSLFNTHRWDASLAAECAIEGLGVVPVLYEGLFDTRTIRSTLEWLEDSGSEAAPGFLDPEGIVVFHKAANLCFKVTIKNDEVPKGLAQ